MLPDARPQAVGPHHRITVLAAPCLLELRHVAERSVDAPFAGGVRIGRDLEPLGFGPLDLAPDLRPAEEEALFGGEPVDGSDLLAAGAARGECFLQRDVGDGESAEIADVLA